MNLMTLILVTLISSTFANENTKGNLDVKKQEMMKKWMEYSTPSESHKLLASLAGKWTFVAKSWETADAKADETKGTSNIKMILGGRFLVQEVKGKMMGQNYEGHGMLGYDNIKKSYDSIWVDSMGTGIMQGTGVYDATTQTITDKGEFTCPFSEKKTSEYKSEWKFNDKNNMTFSLYGKGLENKAEYKMMEITYKRAK